MQEAEITGSSLKNVTGFMGASGLYEDLEAGTVPAFSLIAPNQCTDQHGRGNAGPQCDFDPVDNGWTGGTQPCADLLGDLTLRNIVTSIHASPAWKHGNNAIVVVWDENDYSFVPNVNQVPAIIDTTYGPHGHKSATFYTHFSLLRSIEGGFGLPCLNHACDENAQTMSDLFGGQVAQDSHRNAMPPCSGGWHFCFRFTSVN